MARLALIHAVRVECKVCHARIEGRKNSLNSFTPGSVFYITENQGWNLNLVHPLKSLCSNCNLFTVK